MKANKPYVGVMPGFAYMEKYKGIEMLDELFSHYNYDLGRIREQMWFFYRWAVVHSANLDSPKMRRKFTRLFNTMSRLTTASYLICQKEGKSHDHKFNVEGGYFPIWRPFTVSPIEVIAATFRKTRLDQYRARLWKMQSFALQNIYSYNDKGEMDDLFFLFERLNDLFTACYHIYKKRNKHAKS